MIFTADAYNCCCFVLNMLQVLRNLKWVASGVIPNIVRNSLQILLDQ